MLTAAAYAPLQTKLNVKLAGGFSTGKTALHWWTDKYN